MPSQGLKSFFLRDRFLVRSNLVELALGVIVVASLEAVFDSFMKDIWGPIFFFIGGMPDLFSLRPFGLGIGNFINTLVAFAIRIAVLYFVFVLPLNYLSRRRSSNE